jgi:hypothetical protein
LIQEPKIQVRFLDFRLIEVLGWPMVWGVDGTFFRHPIPDHTNTHPEHWWCRLLNHNSAYRYSTWIPS